MLISINMPLVGSEKNSCLISKSGKSLSIYSTVACSNMSFNRRQGLLGPLSGHKKEIWSFLGSISVGALTVGRLSRQTWRGRWTKWISIPKPQSHSEVRKAGLSGWGKARKPRTFWKKLEVAVGHGTAKEMWLTERTGSGLEEDRWEIVGAVVRSKRAILCGWELRVGGCARFIDLVGSEEEVRMGRRRCEKSGTGRKVSAERVLEIG